MNSPEFTGERSLKVKVLKSVFGPQWEQSVLHWDEKLLTRTEIAEKWTALAPIVERPDVRFSQQDVSDIVALARRRAQAEGGQP